MVTTAPRVDPDTLGGLLLTGGASRRLGWDKAAAVCEPTPGRPEPLSVLLGRRLRAVTGRALEVGPGRSGLPPVVDDLPGAGPLAAIAAGWAALGRCSGRPVSGALVLACDLPRVSVELLRLLAGWPGEASVVPVVAGRPQYLLARWSSAALGRAAELVATGRRATKELSVVAPVTFLAEPGWGRVADAEAFADVDTPEDARRLGVHPR